MPFEQLNVQEEIKKRKSTSKEFDMSCPRDISP